MRTRENKEEYSVSAFHISKLAFGLLGYGTLEALYFSILNSRLCDNL